MWNLSLFLTILLFSNFIQAQRLFDLGCLQAVENFDILEPIAQISLEDAADCRRFCLKTKMFDASKHTTILALWQEPSCICSLPERAEEVLANVPKSFCTPEGQVERNNAAVYSVFCIEAEVWQGEDMCSATQFLESKVKMDAEEKGYFEEIFDIALEDESTTTDYEVTSTTNERTTDTSDGESPTTTLATGPPTTTEEGQPSTASEETDKPSTTETTITSETDPPSTIEGGGGSTTETPTQETDLPTTIANEETSSTEMPPETTVAPTTDESGLPSTEENDITTEAPTTEGPSASSTTDVPITEETSVSTTTEGSLTEETDLPSTTEEDKVSTTEIHTSQQTDQSSTTEEYEPSTEATTMETDAPGTTENDWTSGTTEETASASTTASPTEETDQPSTTETLTSEGTNEPSTTGDFETTTEISTEETNFPSTTADEIITTEVPTTEFENTERTSTTGDIDPTTTETPTTEDTDAPTTEGTEAPSTEGPTTEGTEGPTTEDTDAPTTEGTERPTTEDIDSPSTEGPTTEGTASPNTEGPTTEDTDVPSTEGPSTEYTGGTTTEDTEGPTTEGTDVPSTDGATTGGTEGSTTEGTDVPSTDGTTTEGPSTEYTDGTTIEDNESPSTEDTEGPTTDGTDVPSTDGATTEDTDGTTTVDTESPSTEGTDPSTDSTTTDNTDVPSTEGPTTEDTEGSTTEVTDVPTTEGPTTEDTDVPSTEGPTTEDIEGSTTEVTDVPSTDGTTTEDTDVPSTEGPTTEGTEGSTTEVTDVPSTEGTTTEDTDVPSTDGTTTEDTDVPSTDGTTTEDTDVPSTEGPTTEGTEGSTTEVTDDPSTDGTTTEDTDVPSTDGTTTEDTDVPSTDGTTTEDTDVPSTEGPTTEDTDVPSTDGTTTEGPSTEYTDGTTTGETESPSTEGPTTEETEGSTTEVTDVPSTEGTTTEDTDVPSTDGTTTEDTAPTTTDDDESTPTDVPTTENTDFPTTTEDVRTPTAEVPTTDSSDAPTTTEIDISTTEIPTTDFTESSSTTEQSEGSTTETPSSQETDLPTTETTIIPSTTEYENSTSSTPIPTTEFDNSTTPAPTTEFDNSTTPAPTTEFDTSTTPAPTTEFDTSTTPAPTTEFDTSTTPAPPIPTTEPPPTTSTSDCVSLCNATTDRYEDPWVTCVDTTLRRDCPGASDGDAIWVCMADGKFNGSKPDYSDCRNKWLGPLMEDLEAADSLTHEEAFELLSRMKALLADSANSEVDTTYFGHEMKSMFGMGETILSKLESASELETLTEQVLDVFSDILTFSDPWEELSPQAASDTGTSFIAGCENTALELENRQRTSSAAAKRARRSVRAVLHTHNFDTFPDFRVMSGLSTSPAADDPLLSYPESYSSKDTHIQIPNEWIRFYPEGAPFTGMELSAEYANRIFPAYRNTLSDGEIVENDNQVINGQLVSFTLNDTSRRLEFTEDVVKIAFRHDVYAYGSEVNQVRRKLHNGERRKAVRDTAACVYWNPVDLMWSSEGCRLTSVERDFTICECTHLTSFAIIMDLHNYIGKELGLEILNFILLPLSVVCLVLNIIVFAYNQMKEQVLISHPRNDLVIHLCSALLIANLLLLITVDRNYLHLSDDACVAFAVVLHYVFLCAFAWMAAEGVLLSKLIFIDIFGTGLDFMKTEIVAAYLIPAIIVGITCAINFSKDHHGYGNDSYCWLNGNYLWSFAGPVALVVVFNAVVLISAVRKSYNLHSHPKVAVQRKAKSASFWIRTSLSLTSLMGLTWIFGFFMFINNSTFANVAAYIFTVLNASQGIFIFVCYVLLNEKVRGRLGCVSSEPAESRDDTGFESTLTFGSRMQRATKRVKDWIRRKESITSAEVAGTPDERAHRSVRLTSTSSNSQGPEA